jgi:hypothetical protein
MVKTADSYTLRSVSHQLEQAVRQINVTNEHYLALGLQLDRIYALFNERIGSILTMMTDTNARSLEVQSHVMRLSQVISQRQLSEQEYHDAAQRRVLQELQSHPQGEWQPQAQREPEQASQAATGPRQHAAHEAGEAE